MTIAYFDCYSGISGDMTLGALVDLGLPFEDLKRQLEALPVHGYTIDAKRVKRCGIGATQVSVRLDGVAPSDSHGHEHGHEPHNHGHSHDHEHGHEPHSHGHEHEHHHHDRGHGHSHDHGEHHHDHHQPHRGFSEIRDIIQRSGFSKSVQERAIEAFHKIAVAEAAVHETTVEAVHFHEVGAVDAIVDIVGAMWGIEALGIKSVIASPVAVGSGTIKVAHGVMPIPAPATARLLADKPIVTGAAPGELTTPTGAAILTTLAAQFGPLDNFAISKIGYGAGSREHPDHTNYLRVLMGQQAGSTTELPLDHEQLLVITTEIDDMPAEIFGHVMERLFDLGCLDVQIVPTQMKKNRPGASLHVLLKPDTKSAAIELLLRETSTFGLKVMPCERYSLRRNMETVQTTYGAVRVKIGYWGNEVIKRTPEYEDCRRLAVEHGVPFMQIFLAASTTQKDSK